MTKSDLDDADNADDCGGSGNNIEGSDEEATELLEEDTQTQPHPVSQNMLSQQGAPKRKRLAWCKWGGCLHMM